MTDRQAPPEGTPADAPAPAEAPAPRERARKPRPLPTVLAAVAIFAVAFEFLAFQLSAGRDPALSRQASATPVTATRPAKKLIITKVIPAGGAGQAGTTYSSSGAVAAPAPVVTSSS